MLKILLSKEDYKKVALIKKYAKIRFKKFWNEYGISQEKLEDLVCFVTLFSILCWTYLLGYILICIFL